MPTIAMTVMATLTDRMVLPLPIPAADTTTHLKAITMALRFPGITLIPATTTATLGFTGAVITVDFMAVQGLAITAPDSVSALVEGTAATVGLAIVDSADAGSVAGRNSRQQSSRISLFDQRSRRKKRLVYHIATNCLRTLSW